MPPKASHVEQTIDQLFHVFESFELSFVSVTYGAGGSTRERTAELIDALLAQGAVTPMAHLTCIAHSREVVDDILRRYQDVGLANVLALLGDPPVGQPDFVSPHAFLNAQDLVSRVRAVGDFSVGVALHPEGHPASRDWQQDLEHQAQKLRVADFGITQFFFDADKYATFVEEMRTRDAYQPVIPGIIAPRSAAQLHRLAQLSGAVIPDWVRRRILRHETEAKQSQAGVQIADELVQQLIGCGAPGAHLYTMNNVHITQELLTRVSPYFSNER